ncbi:class II major histocompatibility complex transactivator [Phyllostomus discolor]|uniref:MHC class II transactivator n=1 Tax=Phyllostomus discolor TaxID=89673 RepID=A0A7E6DCX6_9CHIR|nr:MHC class II transactivator isoform X2 [Phyllostomus discolor]KAF6123643.1 class II major histocompatibility complex transactivator [Phyllostomus discolor]
MNHFQTILTQVRMLLSSHQPSQVQALLDNMLHEELLSREYHCALLHEPDAEALARKISLTLLQKGDPDLALLGWAWSGLQCPMVEKDPSYQDHGGSGHCEAMDFGPLEGGYLELLNSNADPFQLYHLYDQMELAGEEMELCSEPDMDTINCEQFSRMLCDIEGDEETREAYANIAELDQYVFQDSQFEGPSKDVFIEHIGLEDIISESVEMLEEAGQKSQKRPFPEELPGDLKHMKLVPASSSLLSCLSLPAGPIHIIPTLPLPQGLWQISGSGTEVSNILIYQGKMPQASQAPPSSSPVLHSLPKSPDRLGSTSPFAPSATDLPNMPEPALTSRANVTENETSPTQCPAALEVSSKLPKWPESVEQFCRSLRDKYQAEPAGPEGILVEVDLMRVQLEKSSSKSQERELVTLDWAERQPACRGLAEVLLAATDRRQLRETQVIAVLGRAGQGKSHWARAVSRTWACGQLPQYDFVFYLPCHCLDRSGDTYRLQDLLFSLGPQPLPVDNEVFGHILRRPDRVLLILDAFEELEAQDSLLHSTCGATLAEPRSLRGLLAGLLQRKLLRGCTLLLTVRSRGRLALSLSKADALFEMASFSAEQAETYVLRYFEQLGATHHQERALVLLQGQPFLHSHSHSPTVCRAVCQLSEALLELGEEAELPSTLTGLYVGLLSPAVRDSPPGALEALARLAWEQGRRHHSTLKEGQLPSAEVKAWAVAKGLVQCAPGAPETELAFSSFLLQCFLGALWLALSTEIKDKELPQYLALTPRKKKPYDNWLDGVPRFLVGLVFQPRTCCLGTLTRSVAATVVNRKQKVLTRYLKRLQPGLLQSGRLLELLHCAHEALDTGLWQHVVQGLPTHLSFLGTRLMPPDIHVLASTLETAGRDFSLDLRSTGIDPSGLRSLVGLSCVIRFRAALSDTVGLWESLQQQGEDKLLQAVEEKFTIEPFKAKSMKDVEDLGNLVQIQRTKSSSEDTAGELPAIRDLKKLEFALGPVLGPQAFPKLVRILEAFSSLQHLDLDSLSENKIGDEGVAQLSATFPQLKALETLNLSQNSITDVGACKLAEALPSLAASLLRLSLYNNCIGDVGAKSLAHVLPDMVSLRVLDVQYNKFTAAGAQQLTASLRKCPHVETLAMWTPTIPFGVQEHLQQLDSRISLR